MGVNANFLDSGKSLSRISVNGFRSIRSLKRLKLDQLNVLVGSNGSGKSNLMKVFTLLRDLSDQSEHVQPLEAMGGFEVNRHRGRRQSYDIKFELSFMDGGTLKLKNNRGEGFNWPSKDKLSSRRDIGKWRVYDFCNADAMRRKSYVSGHDLLVEDGRNLASVLYWLRENRHDDFRILRQTYRLSCPFLGGFFLNPYEFNEAQIELVWRDLHGRKCGANTLSDASLRFLALVTILRTPEDLRPPILFLENPDLGLHPHAVSLLHSMISSYAVHTQVVLTTQNPYFLDHFDPDDIIVANLVDGETEFKRLTNKDLDEWLEDESLGQLWCRNHFGGRP